jgi:FkbM family methyltransferase
LNPFKAIIKPEYLFRPRQVLTRLSRIGKQPRAIEEVTLPWGAVISVHTNENIGGEIYWYGIFDKIVPETITRLLDRGEFAIEVGANIGQNCSLMAARSGSRGRVLAFEPHPEIQCELQENVARWRSPGWAPIQIEPVALGSREGQGRLDDGAEFRTNRGSAALRTPDEQTGRLVSIMPLDKYLNSENKVGVCKVDVEGHELEVFHGAEKALSAGLIRDIVFEDFSRQPSPVWQYLAGFGYTIFGLSSTWLKPHLTAGEAPPEGYSWTFNYLASLDPDRAKKRFQTPGWKCLRCIK